MTVRSLSLLLHKVRAVKKHFAAEAAHRVDFESAVAVGMTISAFTPNRAEETRRPARGYPQKR